MAMAIRRDLPPKSTHQNEGKLEDARFLLRRNPMRSPILLLALVSAALTGVTVPASAQSPYSYPWCSKQIYGRGDVTNSCYFTSHAQCMATAWPGIGGWCYQNPAYNGARNSLPTHRRRHY
jgi:hypothetical protein